MKKILPYLLLCLFLFKVNGFSLDRDNSLKVETKESIIVNEGETIEMLPDGTIIKVIDDKETNPIIREMKKAFFRDVRVGYFYNVLGIEEKDRGRLGVSSPFLSYKAFSLDPLILYNPASAHSTTEFAASFNVILLGNRNQPEELEYVKKSKRSGKRRIIDRMFLGMMTFQNFSSGKFGFGIQVGLIF